MHTSLISKLLLAIILYLFFFTANLNFIKEYLWENFYEVASEAGFKLETVIIKGNRHIDQTEIVAALNADIGTPLFSISLEKSYHRLKKNNWIRNLSVMRKLPNTIVIHIIERTPIAIWQHEKKLFRFFLFPICCGNLKFLLGFFEKRYFRLGNTRHQP